MDEAKLRDMIERSKVGDFTEEEKARAERNIGIVQEALDQMLVSAARHNDPMLTKGIEDFKAYISGGGVEATMRFAAVCSCILWLEEHIDRIGEAHMLARLSRIEQRAAALKMAAMDDSTEMKH